MNPIPIPDLIPEPINPFDNGNEDFEPSYEEEEEYD